MQVVLKVVGGKNDGREISIAVPRFIIGRGETAHLRPASDLVSREHTVIEVKDDKVFIVDLNSRNGTFVNGNKITAPHVARAGDSVRIGRLQFEMVIDPVKAGTKKPKITNVIDAAARTASSPKASLEDSITDWLLEVNDNESGPDSTERAIIGAADTIQFNLDETTSIRKEKESDSGSNLEDSSVSDSQATEILQGGKKAKAKPMKLPPMEKPKHDSSTSAADDVLKKFFNRR